MERTDRLGKPVNAWTKISDYVTQIIKKKEKTERGRQTQHTQQVDVAPGRHL